MEEPHRESGWREDVEQDKTPEVVRNEPDDKPAANNLRWTIIISVIVLLAIYLMFFHFKE